MGEILKIGIIGAGSRGLNSYGRILESWSNRAVVVAVAEPRKEYREVAVRRHSIPPQGVFDNWQSLLEARPELDAVIIATNDKDHFAPATRAMEHGYHVLLEKPMAITEGECRGICATAEQSGVILAVCHVLRYTNYFRALKRLLEEGRIGKLITLRHFEQIGYWHFAHSYVRGNWRSSKESSPVVLAKCCHDLDILRYLVGARCTQISSYGSLEHFTTRNAPQGAANRCVDCQYQDTGCPYSAKSFYLGLLEEGKTDWPLNVLSPDPSQKSITEALNDGPYGRCVYSCDNDVADHQVLALEFEGGVTAGFTLTAFTGSTGRQTELYGSHGEIRGNGSIITIRTFESDAVENIEVDLGDDSVSGGHMGGDAGILDAFLSAVAQGAAAEFCAPPREILESHLMAFAAERSRLTGQSVSFNSALEFD